MTKGILTLINPFEADSFDAIRIGDRLFTDDIWDLSPFIPRKSMPESAKKLRFGRIKNQNIKHTVKLYAYYKLGQIKPQTVIGILNSILPNFVKYCEFNDIRSFAEVGKDTLLQFAQWLKTDRNLSKRTGYMASFSVEDIIHTGQIKGWDVPVSDVLSGVTAAEIWGSGKDEHSLKKVQPIPEYIFNKVLDCALHREKDIVTKSGIVIQSQTGLRVSEVLSIRKGCLHRPENGPAYLEVTLSKTEKGEPFIHKVYVNELVIAAVNELTRHTEALRLESGLQELFLVRINGIRVPNAGNWSCKRLATFVKRWDIRDGKGNLYPLRSHQFRATFVRDLIMKRVPIAYVMKQFSHVSIEMTCHYLTLREQEVKEIYSHMIFSPGSRIAGKRAEEIQRKTMALFRGRTETEIEKVIDSLADTLSFNPLPGGVCLYDYRRGNCTNGDGCFFYNCPNYISEVSFLPVLQRELELMEIELERTKKLGLKRQWQVQYVRYRHLKPLVESLEVMKNEEERQKH